MEGSDLAQLSWCSIFSKVFSL